MSFVRLLSKNTFFTAPDGRRVFYPFGMFTRGYVVPDCQTQARLAHRYTWATVLGAGLVFPPMVGALFREMHFRSLDLPEPAYFFGVLVAGTVALCALMWVILRGVVRGLARYPLRLSWRTVAARNAAELSRGELVLLIWTCAAFMIGGFLIAAVKSVTIGLAIVAFGVAGGAMGWYTLRLQRRLVDAPERPVVPPPW